MREEDDRISCAIHDHEPELRKGQLEKFSAFSAKEKRAILGFLRFMAEHSQGRADAKQASAAIDDYWAENAT